MNINIPLLSYQREFVLSDAKYTALVGGYGTGKSYSIYYKALYLLAKRQGKGVILIVEPNYGMIQRNIIPIWISETEKTGILYKYNKQQNKITYNSHGIEGTIYFLSGEKPDSIAGIDGSDFIIDEFDRFRNIQLQQDVWRELTARLRKVVSATGSIVTTPNGFMETYNLFVENGGLQNGKLIKARTEDNMFLPPEFVEDLRQQFDPKVIEQYLNGDFVDISSLPALYNWNDKYIVAQNYADEKLKQASVIHIGMDFNVSPMCASISVLEYNVKGKKLTVCNEIILDDSNTYDMVDHIKRIYPNKTYYVYPDMTGGSRKTSSRETDHRILKQNGFKIQRGNLLTNGSQVDRLNECNSALYQENIAVSGRCKNVISDFNKTNRKIDGRIDKSRETDGKSWGHMFDAITYCIQRVFPIKSKATMNVRSS